MTTPNFINALSGDRAGVLAIDETVPDDYIEPANPTTITLYNDRIDLLARRIYGTNHSVALRTLIWANDFDMNDWLRIFPEGIIVNTPPVIAQVYSKEQTIIE